MTFEERLDAMELEIRKPIFRKNRGRANEVNYWVFDYPPEKELEVRARIERMQQKNVTGNDDFKLVVFDLYDYIIDTLEKEGFLDQCYRFEDRRGIDRIVKAVGNLLCVNDEPDRPPYRGKHPGKRHRVPDRHRQVLPAAALPQGTEQPQSILWPRAGGAVLPRHV